MNDDHSKKMQTLDDDDDRRELKNEKKKIFGQTTLPNAKIPGVTSVNDYDEDDFHSGKSSGSEQKRRAKVMAEKLSMKDSSPSNISSSSNDKRTSGQDVTNATYVTKTEEPLKQKQPGAMATAAGKRSKKISSSEPSEAVNVFRNVKFDTEIDSLPSDASNKSPGAVSTMIGKRSKKISSGESEGVVILANNRIQNELESIKPGAVAAVTDRKKKGSDLTQNVTNIEGTDSTASQGVQAASISTSMEWAERRKLAAIANVHGDISVNSSSRNSESNETSNDIINIKAGTATSSTRPRRTKVHGDISVNSSSRNSESSETSNDIISIKAGTATSSTRPRRTKGLMKDANVDHSNTSSNVASPSELVRRLPSVEDIGYEKSMKENNVSVGEERLPMAYVVDESATVSPENAPESPIYLVEAEPMLPWYRQKKFVGSVLVIISVSVIIIVALVIVLSDKQSFRASMPSPSPTPFPSVSKGPSTFPSLSPTGYIEAERASLLSIYQITNGDYWYNSSGWGDHDPNSNVCGWFGITCGVQFGEVIHIDLSNNNVTSSSNIEDENTLRSNLLTIASLEKINLSLNDIKFNMTEMSKALKDLSNLNEIDFRFNSRLTGIVTDDLCIHNGGGNDANECDYNILVDCSIECKCCKHDVFCACEDFEEFVDRYNDECDWYEKNEDESCPVHGNETNNDGVSPNDACCHCGGGIITSILVPSTSPTIFPTSMLVQNRQKEILTQLFDDLQGSNWNDLGGWFEPDISPCNWSGIRCSQGQVVTRIILNNNNLRGSISSTIGGLEKLEVVNFADNVVTGNIPSEIGYLSMLGYLRLSQNFVSGSLPSEIGLLRMLNEFVLDTNELTGTLPLEFGNAQKLKRVNLSTNKLSGTIPNYIAQFNDLNELDLSNNLLTGTIPSMLRFIPKLGVLYLRNNNLTGPLPTELSDLTELKKFEVNQNALNGTIPASYGLLSRLEKIDLSNNYLTGFIPKELGNLLLLEEIILSNNGFVGLVPSELGLLPNLELLDLQNTLLGGWMPSELCARTENENDKLSIIIDQQSSIVCPPNCCTIIN